MDYKKWGTYEVLVQRTVVEHVYVTVGAYSEKEAIEEADDGTWEDMPWRATEINYGPAISCEKIS